LCNQPSGTEQSAAQFVFFVAMLQEEEIKDKTKNEQNATGSTIRPHPSPGVSRDTPQPKRAHFTPPEDDFLLPPPAAEQKDTDDAAPKDTDDAAPKDTDDAAQKETVRRAFHRLPQREPVEDPLRPVETR
jgi:hypothetical protein